MLNKLHCSSIYKNCECVSRFKTPEWIKCFDAILYSLMLSSRRFTTRLSHFWDFLGNTKISLWSFMADVKGSYKLTIIKSSSQWEYLGLTIRYIIWAAPSEFGTYRLCEQRRFRRACASAQSRQNLRCSLIQVVSQEEPSDRKPDPWPLWMAGHAQLKFVMTECSKTQIRLARLIYQYYKTYYSSCC